MKTFALTAIAATIALGFVAAPALAGFEDDLKIDTQIVDIDYNAGTLKLANGTTLDTSFERFALPAGAAPGDAVRVTIDGEDHNLKSVVVVR